VVIQDLVMLGRIKPFWVIQHLPRGPRETVLAQPGAPTTGGDVGEAVDDGQSVSRRVEELSVPVVVVVPDEQEGGEVECLN
jgi:hypothetical protein